jgi:predicted O-methyltransferase YrrM
MLEMVGAPGYETISKPAADVLAAVQSLLAVGQEPTVAEIGVGIGATSVEVLRVLDGRGTLDLFDFDAKLQILAGDLRERGYRNFSIYGNTRLHWDCYNWSLLQLMLKDRKPRYDVVFLDGSHAYIHDLGALYLIERMIKPGGLLFFDDYYWSFKASPNMNPTKNPSIKQFLTDEQIEVSNVKVIVEAMVEGSDAWEMVAPKRCYRRR